MAECSAEERAVLDALIEAQSLPWPGVIISCSADKAGPNAVAAAKLLYMIELWRASLSRGAAGSEPRD